MSTHNQISIAPPAIVLLVDDQPIIGAFVRRALDSEDHLHVCTEGQEALAMACKVKPTVILQDLVMPGIDGLDLARSYRSNPLTANVPIVVLSSKEQPTIKSEAFVAGANDYLVKMPDAVELVARIRYHSKSYVSSCQRDHALDFLSHDMRSPQTSILALIEMYRAEHGQLLPVLERIAAYAANALELAEDFTQLTRVQSEWRQFEMVNLNDLMVTAADQLWERAVGKGCRIRVDAPGTELMYLGDRMLLTRLVTNLIDNALKYGPPDSEVRCILSSTQDGLLIAVEDAGPGIPQQDAERAAERFVRLPGTGAGKENGFGLGLAFVNVVANTHRGRMIMNRTSRGFLIGALLPSADGAPSWPVGAGS